MIYKNKDDTLFMGDIRTDALERVAEYMGYDISDPDQLHGFIKNIASKIKAAIQKRRGAAQPGGVYAVQTPSGTVSVTDAGVISATSPEPKRVSVKAKSAGIMDMLQKNPLIIVAAGAAILFVMSQKKR